MHLACSSTAAEAADCGCRWPRVGWSIALAAIALVLPSEPVMADGSAPAAAAAPPANVIFVLSDDQRHDFLGCAGHPVIQTPHIDALAASGVRMTHAYVTTSICAASRATLLTGTVERTHGYTFGKRPVPASLVNSSYPAVLKQAGFRTGFVGKFGVAIKGKPEAEMFDWYRPLNRTPYFKTQPDGTTRHVDDLIGDAALEFLEGTPADQPFCLSVSFNSGHAEDNDKADHFPAPPTEQSMYDDVAVDLPRLTESFAGLPDFLQRSMNRARWHWRWDTQAKYQRNVRGYYGMLSGLDRNIGRLVEQLQRSGRAENTVIIFSGDNGYYRGDRGLAGKWSHFDESMRVPLVVYDPRLPEPQRGRTVDAITLNLDIPATILDYARQPIPTVYQGMSLRPLVSGDAADWSREAFFCEHLMENPLIPKWEGVHGRRWVYARYTQQSPPYEFLHDLQSDPDQLTNLASDPKHRQQLEQMRAATDEAIAQYSADR